MASQVTNFDRIKETFTTTGTGTITCGGAVTGFQTFSAKLPTGGTVNYTMWDGGANWEVGQGTYTSGANTIGRTTIFDSSNAGSPVNFPAGTKTVWFDCPAEALNAYPQQPGTPGYVWITNDGATGGLWSAYFGAAASTSLPSTGLIRSVNVADVMTAVYVGGGAGQYSVIVNTNSNVQLFGVHSDFTTGLSDALQACANNGFGFFYGPGGSGGFVLSGAPLLSFVLPLTVLDQGSAPATPTGGFDLYSLGGLPNTKDAFGRVSQISSQNQALNSAFTTTSTTPAALNFGLAMEANEIWAVDFYLYTLCSATGGMEFEFSGPTGTTLIGQMQGQTAIATNVNLAVSALLTLTSAVSTTAGAALMQRFHLTVTCGSTPGIFQILCKSVTSLQTSTVSAKSRMLAELMAGV